MNINKYKLLLLVTATSQILANFFTNFSGGSNFNELLITPAGYTFSIWGLIIILCLVHAIYHFFKEKVIYSKNFYLALSAVYILFTVWLLAAERNMLLSTVIINFAMFFLLHIPFKEVLEKANLKNNWNKFSLLGGVGVYLGWLTVASIANLGVYFTEFGLVNYTTTGQVIQGGLVLLAVLNSVWMLKKFKNNIVLFATYWWAYVGVLVGLFTRPGTDWLIVETVVLVVALNIFYFKLNKNK